MSSTFSPLLNLIAVFLLLFLVRHTCEARDPFACDPKNGATENMPFCKASLAIPERVKDLVGRLTLQEKVRLLVNNAAAVPRLGMKGYEWWSEALHGVSNVGPGVKFNAQFPGATSFPQVITTAASFNASLWEAIGQVVSDEARAMYNGGTAGLTYWSPNVNIFRDPRWGRGQETPGEDPVLAGTYAASYVRGLQGTDGNRLKVAACCKHFTAYDLDNWNGMDRFHFNAQVSKQDIEETFDVPFRMCVSEGKVASVMCSYNQVNGVPTCADPNLLKKTVRGLWQLDGYIVSDCDSVGVFYDNQHYTPTPEEAAADAIKAGYVTIPWLGPNSKATVTMIGNYAGVACGYTNPLQGIGRYAKTIHQLGCENVACKNDKLFGSAINAARQADATVLVMGLDQSIEAETVDRTGLLLPGRQQDLVSKVAAASKGPTILVIMSGGSVDITFAKNNPRIVGILWAGYPGQAGGAAIADILFGTTNPGGKLPVTWYPQEYLTKLPMTNMAMRGSKSAGYPGRTYRFYNGPVVYPFGHGLTYTHFVHTLASAPTVVSVPLNGHRRANVTNISNRAIRVTHARCDKLSISLEVDIKNVGSRDGTHTLLVFSAPPAGFGHWALEKQLVAFEKIHVPAKGLQRVGVNIHVCKLLSVVDKSGIRRIPLGEHSFNIGDVKHSVSLQAAALGIIKS
ncbi:Putative beta-D-xylosidase 2 [Glycine soja]|uniref:Putative beta-D-xylosidase 2 n=1 Tax=Glycine soja TaxID=3848 RepID=A0A0B2QH27_GLYSO|nr:Putative beta-D-xylosidase 2 [Glycine soja]